MWVTCGEDGVMLLGRRVEVVSRVRPCERGVIEIVT